MGFVLVTVLALALLASGQDPEQLTVRPLNAVDVDHARVKTDLVLAFVVFRHGDRTPDLDELEMFKTRDLNENAFFPYGPKALTNKGKQRSYRVGKYLRSRYNDVLSQLYLPSEIRVRTTEYARTKMTALTALAALYPPRNTPQMWNPDLDWQPVPYDTEPAEEDDLLYYYNCPRYTSLRNYTYYHPQVQEIMKKYKGLFDYLSENTGSPIKTPEDVFYLDNLFQTLNNVKIPTPTWAQDVMPTIKEMTKLEYQLEFYNSELTKLATGVMMREIVDTMSTATQGVTELPKVFLVSGHENNVAAWMAAARVFYLHQPRYGATFSLELRRNKATGKYTVMAVYSPEAGGAGVVLPIRDCGGREECDFDSFQKLTRNVTMTKTEYKAQCPVLYFI